jgi:hypothetical protein
MLKVGTVDLGRPDVASHFQFLIKEPLMRRHECFSFEEIPVIVVDALDECGSDSS